MSESEGALDDVSGLGTVAFLHGPGSEESELGMGLIEESVEGFIGEEEDDRLEAECGAEASLEVDDLAGPGGDGAAEGEDDEVTHARALAELEADHDRPAALLLRVGLTLHLDGDPAGVGVEDEVGARLIEVDEADGGVDELRVAQDASAEDALRDEVEAPGLLGDELDGELMGVVGHG
jgi:hypothetical protein